MAGVLAVGNLELIDNAKAKFGTGDDLQIYHDGSHSYIKNSTNYTYYLSTQHHFKNAADNELQAKFQENEAVSLYYDASKKFETTSGGVLATGDVESSTGIFEHTTNFTTQLKFNTSNETQLKHLSNGQVKLSFVGLSNAARGAIDAQNGFIRILTAADETGIICRDNSSTDLYFDGTKKFETTSYGNLSAAQVRVASSNASTVAFSVGDVGTGFYNSGSNAIGYSANSTQKWQINSLGDLNLADNVKGIFGDGLDLQIYHDGSNSVLLDSGTGNLKIYSNGAGVDIQKSNGENIARFITDGAVELYCDNSKKFETRSDGVTLTGQMVQTSTSARAIALNRLGSAGQMILFDFQGNKCGEILVDTNSTSYVTSGSDKSLKKNFQSWNENVLNLFKNINPQEFHFNNQQDTDKKHKGYIAQDMVDSFPEAYPKDDNGKYMFNPTGMVVYLMKAVQDLIAKVEKLEAE